MKRNRILIAAAVVLALVAVAAGAAPTLRVHLPRTVEVETDALALGSISVLAGADETLARRAADVPMGRAPWPREAMVVDRPTILSRLASCGIPALSVAFTGAEKVTVTRSETTLVATEVVKAAQTLLEKERPAPARGQWRVARQPADAVMPAGGEVRMDARLAPHAVASEAKVEVTTRIGARTVATQAVLFRLGYLRREAVAKADIPAGGMLTPENTEIRTVPGDTLEPPDWTPPYGQLAAQALKPGTAIRPTLVRTVQAQAAVRRNENVLMRIQGSGFTVTAVGLALEDGRPGDFVKIRNVDSMRIVMARVRPDGSVEPVFDEVKR